jgi:hypothetical protein
MSEPLWYRDRKALGLIALRYLPSLAVLSLAWEIAQLPLYTIWTEGTRAEIAFAAVHCTLGDILIGMAALALSLMLTRARAPADWQWGRITILLVILGSGYTVFSEWLNTTLSRWTYSALMPTLNLGGIEIGMSPLAQWLVVPPLALYLARSSRTY